MESTTFEGPLDESTASGESAPEGVRERLRVVTGASWQAAKSRIARVSDDVRIEARSTAHAAERYARQKPWRVAGAAAALALLAGYLIGAQVTTAHWRRQLGR
jgi:ElaB/YqjD/DUF883 family membrane-anchored ribosome-binding protein